MKNVFWSVAGSIGLLLFAPLGRSADAPEPKENIAVDLGGGVTLEFVLIRPGDFIMGSDKYECELPVHKVKISKPFYLGKYEVTQAQWEKVMGANPSTFKGAKNPVESVTWDDCQSFLAKLREKAPGTDFRLPTEAQWEYACRAGTTTVYGFGDSEASLGEYAWYGGNSGLTTHPVGEKKSNAWGLYDMHGNVWEWCADWCDDTYSTDERGSGSLRVLRGGSWRNNATGCRSSYRRRLGPAFRNGYIGLRLVVVPR